MNSLSMKGNMGASRTANVIMEGVLASGLSCELVETINRRIEDCLMYIMVFEKYYMRASNRASLTVVITGDAYCAAVDAIGSGGGQGALFKLSYGAEGSFVGTVRNILINNGFEDL